MENGKRFAEKKKIIFIRTAVLAIPVVLMLLLSQTVFAQNTYVITDGDRILVHTTSMTDPAAVLNEAGLELDQDDTYTTQEDNGVSEITVHRNHTVTIDHCGELLQVNSTGETVEELLNRLNITVDVNTAVSVPLDTEIYDGMELRISRTVRTTENYTVAVPHEVSRVNDPVLPAGMEVILTEGVDGQILRSASVVYVDGQEQSRTVIGEETLTQPVTEVIAVGTNTEESAEDGLVIGDGFIVTETGEILTYTGTMQVKATAYSHNDPGCDFWTATGTRVRIGTVAVDPKMIPYGTRMFIISNDGAYIYGIATAEDCGGAIKDNRIDLYYPTVDECNQFGRRDCTIYFLG